MEERFSSDLKRFYELVLERDREVYALYALLDEGALDRESYFVLLDEIGLERDSENLLALLTRFVSLNETALVQVMKKAGFSEEEIDLKKRVIYQKVRAFYREKNESMLEKVEAEGLLTPFFRELIAVVDRVGQLFCDLHLEWSAHILEDINRGIDERFENSKEAIAWITSILNREGINEIEERSYFALSSSDESATIRSYFEQFETVKRVVAELESSIATLEGLEEGVFGQKGEILAYLTALKDALQEVEIGRLIERWQAVDRAWMRIKTPLQIGHPLEYYEDKYLKAVAPEWDLRLINSLYQESRDIKADILSMYETIAGRLSSPHCTKVLEFSKKAIDNVQLYIGAPALFYGALINGLFSAQVVPNDEVVSSEMGKKIFAYPDRVLQTSRQRPFMEIDREIFDAALLRKSRELLFYREQEWHTIYQISTIGHEFGHILWVDERSELSMNRSGEFKNIEEFKATTGGLVAYFLSESEESLREYLIIDLVKRAIKLIAWRETQEVVPYYCEGLMHLGLLFESGLLRWDEKISIDSSRYYRLKELYTLRYRELAEHYLEKDDASLFLYRYLDKKKNIYMPKERQLYSFVEHYWRRYQEIGQKIDSIESNKYWMK